MIFDVDTHRPPTVERLAEIAFDQEGDITALRKEVRDLRTTMWINFVSILVIPAAIVLLST